MTADASTDEGTALKPAILVSACLVGVPCNHRGRGSPSPAVLALAAQHRLVPVCPEVAGGLPTPRPAADLLPDGRVVTADGTDVTAFYVRGAAAAVALARAVGASRAVLKARSPSCGCHSVDDGTFDREVLVQAGGRGVTAQALMTAGFEVSDEEEEAAASGAGWG